MSKSMLVKIWAKNSVDEVLMLVEEDKEEEWLEIARDALLAGAAKGVEISSINYEIVINNIEAPETFALDHNRPYVG